MTERLGQLLREEGESLTIPAPPTAAVLRDGRRRRTRSRVLAGGGALGLVAATTAIVLSVSGLGAGDTDRWVEPAAVPYDGWAIASGSTIQLGPGRTTEVKGTVKSLFLTSAGLVVQHGDNADPDEGASFYTVLAEDGERSTFEMRLDDRIIGTDADQPYLAYAEPAGADRWRIVVRDVRGGDVLSEVVVEGSDDWAGWKAPPVALDGDSVYVGLDEATQRVRWRTGEVEIAEHLSTEQVPVVSGGRAVVPSGETEEVVIDVASGEVLSEAVDRTQQGAASISLAPGGRSAIFLPYRLYEGDDTVTWTWEADTATAVNLADGVTSEVALVDGGDLGWSDDGALIKVAGDEVLVCDVADVCESTPLLVDGANLRVAGSFYGS